MLETDPKGILVRYNVITESELSADELARELFPSDVLLCNIVEAVYEGRPAECEIYNSTVCFI